MWLPLTEPKSSRKAVHACLHIVLLCWKNSSSHALKALPFQSLFLLIPFNHSDLAQQSQDLLTSWATKQFQSPHTSSQKNGKGMLKSTYSSHFIYFSRGLPIPSLRHWGWRVSFAFIWWVFHLLAWHHWQLLLKSANLSLFQASAILKCITWTHTHTLINGRRGGKSTHGSECFI